MSKTEWDLLERIFSDCHVKDIDLSEWDRRLSLLVVADHVRGDELGRKPPLLIHFVRVHEFRVIFNHLEIETPESGAHFQWQVDTLVDKTRKGEGIRRVSISGLAATPTLEVGFEKIEIEYLRPDELDRGLPSWTDPSGPFARPGIRRILRGRHQ